VQFQFIALFAVPIVFALHFVLVEEMRLTKLHFHQSQLLLVSQVRDIMQTSLLLTPVRQVIISETPSMCARAARHTSLLR
jgi:hypothetical protein